MLFAQICRSLSRPDLSHRLIGHEEKREESPRKRRWENEGIEERGGAYWTHNEHLSLQEIQTAFYPARIGRLWTVSKSGEERSESPWDREGIVALQSDSEGSFPVPFPFPLYPFSDPIALPINCFILFLHCFHFFTILDMAMWFDLCNLPKVANCQKRNEEETGWSSKTIRKGKGAWHFWWLFKIQNF